LRSAFPRPLHAARRKRHAAIPPVWLAITLLATLCGAGSVSGGRLGRPIGVASAAHVSMPADLHALQAARLRGANSAAPNPTVLENQLPGTDAWMDDNGPNTMPGFATSSSVNVGGTIGFAFSDRTAGVPYTLKFYRLGWYGGAGGRLVLTVPNVLSRAQGYWTPGTWGLSDCPTCLVDPTTGLLDTGWAPIYSLTVPDSWTSGVYLLQALSANGRGSYVLFVVRDDSRASDIVVQAPTNTLQAYNDWGGKSLYGGVGPTTVAGSAQAVKVSFNRPFDKFGPGAIATEVQVVRFLERNGYDVTYAASEDVDRDPNLLLNHLLFLSVGHDEYWTKQMRDNGEAARDAGVSVAFFGGNDVYWQSRYEPDRNGVAQRVMVMYRDASIDPFSQTAPAQASVQFVQPPVNRPQNGFTGLIFAGSVTGTQSADWIVAPSAPDWLLAGTGLAPGDHVPGLVADECDFTANNGAQPPGLTVVASSPVNTTLNGDSHCDTVLYTAPSGAVVFNAGTRGWPAALDSCCAHYADESADARIQILVQNLLAQMGVLPSPDTGS
jgi:hypothetical protein